MITKTLIYKNILNHILFYWFYHLIHWNFNQNVTQNHQNIEVFYFLITNLLFSITKIIYLITKSIFVSIMKNRCLSATMKNYCVCRVDCDFEGWQNFLTFHTSQFQNDSIQDKSKTRIPLNCAFKLKKSACLGH